MYGVSAKWSPDASEFGDVLGFGGTDQTQESSQRAAAGPDCRGRAGRCRCAFLVPQRSHQICRGCGHTGNRCGRRTPGSDVACDCLRMFTMLLGNRSKSRGEVWPDCDRLLIGCDQRQFRGPCLQQHGLVSRSLPTGGRFRARGQHQRRRDQPDTKHSPTCERTGRGHKHQSRRPLRWDAAGVRPWQ